MKDDRRKMIVSTCGGHEASVSLVDALRGEQTLVRAQQVGQPALLHENCACRVGDAEAVKTDGDVGKERGAVGVVADHF